MNRRLLLAVMWLDYFLGGFAVLCGVAAALRRDVQATNTLSAIATAYLINAWFIRAGLKGS